MRIALGCDHAAFELKETIKSHLEAKEYEVADMGTFDKESVDYPDYAFFVGKAVTQKECDFGIVVCGSGIGISIAANKIPGIRAALCGDLWSAQLCREHNDANVLAIGARVTGEGLALEIVDKFLSTDFAGGRHQRRVDKITTIEDMMAVERAEQIAQLVKNKEK